MTTQFPFVMLVCCWPIILLGEGVLLHMTVTYTTPILYSVELGERMKVIVAGHNSLVNLTLMYYRKSVPVCFIKHKVIHKLILHTLAILSMGVE